MRYVDIDQLELPNGWEVRAEQALNDLRAEIDRADADARVKGDDPVVARKATIVAGLKTTTREHIWKDLKNNLATISKDFPLTDL